MNDLFNNYNFRECLWNVVFEFNDSKLHSNFILQQMKDLHFHLWSLRIKNFFRKNHKWTHIFIFNRSTAPPGSTVSFCCWCSENNLWKLTKFHQWISKIVKFHFKCKIMHLRWKIERVDKGASACSSSWFGIIISSRRNF